MNKRAIALLAAGMLSAGHLTVAVAAGTAVGGRVVNGTAGGTSPGGIEVTVVQVNSSGTEKKRQTVTTSGSGTFEAAGFDHSEGDSYIAGARLAGVTYSAVAKPPQPVEITVYETTTDDAVIEVASDTVTIVEGEQDQIEVLQLMRIVNGSDRTFVGTNEAEVLVIPVPEGAFDVSFGEGVARDRITQGKQGFITRDPVLPGETTISYAYKVRAARSGWSMRRAVVYPTDKIDVLMGEGLLLDGDMAHQETKTIGDNTYNRYRAGPFGAGAILGIDVRYRQEGSMSPGSLAGYTLSGLAALVLGSAAIVRIRRSRRSRPPATPNRQELIDEIARLDEGFARQQIEEAEYRRLRAEKIEILQDMTL